MVTGDGAYIKKINRSLILENIVEHGMISRADLSKVTGLNKATISVQVADLLENDLIIETQHEHNSVGRRPIMLSIKRDAGYALGIDLDSTEITYTLSNLIGETIKSHTHRLETSDYQEIVTTLANQIHTYEKDSSNTKYGLVSVVIAVHGTVNKDESVFFIPYHQWHNKDLKHDLEEKINTKVFIDNNANLSTFAEKVYKYPNIDNLLSIIMYSGIGLGIIMDGELIKGYHGYAGEMGHMILHPDGLPCKCGNNGCWELYASEASFFGQISKQLDQEHITYQEIKNQLNEKESIVTEQMDQFIKNVSIGLNNVINLYNPETIVLNSKLLQLNPNSINQIESHLNSSVSQYRDLVLSNLGKKAVVLGACAHGIKNFLGISKLSLQHYS